MVLTTSISFTANGACPTIVLKKCLEGSHEWADFITCDEGGPLPGGIGDTDYWKADIWKDFVGVTVRTYDPKTGLWRIYWVDNTFSGRVIQPGFHSTALLIQLGP
jgi:hypothetical protein